MSTNHFPEKPTHTQPTEVLTPPMEGLQPRVVQSSPPASETKQDVDNSAERLEEARTVRYAIGKLNDFLQWFMIVLEVLLAIRVFFKLIGASEANLFAGFLYSLTGIVLFPFVNIVHTDPRFAADALIAMIIYWLLFIAIRRFLHILVTGPEETAS